MFKFLRERKKDNKGFTLVELVNRNCHPCNSGRYPCTSVYKVC